MPLAAGKCLDLLCNPIRAARAAVPMLAMLAFGSASAAPAPDPATNLYFVRFAAEQWPDAGDLVANRTGFSPPYGGTLATFGLGIGIAYLRRIGGAPGGAFYLGGEFSGYANSGDQQYAGTWAGTGQPVQASLYANPGYVVLSGRYAVRRSGGWGWHATGAGGLYLLSIKDDIEGMSVDTGVHDRSFGGYFGLGVDRADLRRSLLFELEARVHLFEFDDLQPGFPGQSAGGPMFELALGFAWAS